MHADAQPFRSDELDVPALLANLPMQLSHAQLARLLWASNYHVLFIAELKQYAHIGTPMLELYESLRSQRRQVELLDDAAALLRVASTVATLAREQSLAVLPLSTVSRSISYLNQRVPSRVWAAERKQRRLVHKSVAIKILRLMLECRPPPAFEVCRHNRATHLLPTRCPPPTTHRPPTAHRLCTACAGASRCVVHICRSDVPRAR